MRTLKPSVPACAVEKKNGPGISPALLKGVFIVKCKLSDFLVYKIKEWFEANGRDTAVIGISGGKDSTVVAALCARALGPEHVMGILMPN